MDKKVELSGVYLAALIPIVLLIGFVAGTRSEEIYAFIGPVVGVKTESAATKLNDSSLQDVYQTLKTHYNGKIDDKALIDGAKHGMVAATGDPYTMYFSKKEAADFNNELSGDIGAGIGAEIGIRSGQPTILRALANNPAEKAGLHAGDVIIAVNDESANGWAADKAVQAIRGQKGTSVKLVIKRAGETKEFTITRDTINNPSVSSELRGDVGIMTVNRFDEETVSLVRKTVDDLKNKGMKKLVVDMRGNGGGYLDAAPGVAGMWLDNQVVVSVRANKGGTDRLMSEGQNTLKGVKTAVIVNGSSASATEIVTAALKYYKVATIVGEKTYGKGSVQELIPLTDDTMLKVTIKRWYTPGDANVNGKGITPDITVGLTQADLDAGRDPQLEKAIQVVSQ